MLTITETKKILNSYNINSNNYGPTIYASANEVGICLDIKDPTFGFLTRAFTFDSASSLNEFLKGYNWFKSNHQKYSHLSFHLSKYDIKNPKIIYTYEGIEITIPDMINLQNIIEESKNKIINHDLKNNLLANIKALTPYLINLKQNALKNRQEKNTLKIRENDLKYELLQQLVIYYGQNKPIIKKGVSQDIILSNNNDIVKLETNLKNITSKSQEEIENYLRILINLTKEEELNEPNLINIYSNNIYRYNIEILTKQIAFVKSKIASEINFNIKGSKNHNIDAELKSFVKPNATPKIDEYLRTNKSNIINKYEKITNLTNAYSIITGNQLELIKTNIPSSTKETNSTIINLTEQFDSLDKTTKNNLILYHSLFKNICNFIIENNFPDLNIIKNHFDFEYYYTAIEEIIHNENNSHYLINYFNNINFKTLDNYLNSLIDISKTVATTSFIITDNLLAFSIIDNSQLSFTTNPIYNNDKVYMVNLPASTKVLFIPTKLEIDDDTQEITTLTTNSIYYQGEIIDTNDQLIVNKYNKINEKHQNSDIIITSDLTLNQTTIFKIGKLKGVN